MAIICLEAPAWRRAPGPDPALQAPLLALAPRVALEAQGALWADGRGLDAAALAGRLLARLEELGVGAARAGVADTPVAARAAARTAGAGVRVVPPGTDRAFLAPLPLVVLDIDEPLLLLLDGVGVATCGALAVVPREAVEVRFGGAAVTPWRRARADDARRLFVAPLPVQPHASMDFVDYVVTDPERLVFTANALLGRLLEGLAGRGEHARALTLSLPLANGQTWRRTLRAARPTASRELWLRRLRDVLDRLTVEDAVAGMALRVEGAEAAGSVQGDLFDPGFASAGAAEAAVARLLDTGTTVVEARPGRHPLAERRTLWQPVAPEVLRERPRSAGAGQPAAVASAAAEAAGALTLQLLPEPRPVRVETAARRDHQRPLRYHDGRWHQLETVAGPERVSGGVWEEEAYAREYFRAVTGQGALVWLFRDAVRDRWFLHGWWD